MPLRRLRKLAHGRFIDARVLLLCGGGPHADGKVWRVVEVVAALGGSQRTIERIKERFLEECLGTATVNLMRRFSMIPVFFAHPQVTTSCHSPFKFPFDLAPSQNRLSGSLCLQLMWRLLKMNCRVCCGMSNAASLFSSPKETDQWPLFSPLSRREPTAKTQRSVLFMNLEFSPFRAGLL